MTQTTPQIQPDPIFKDKRIVLCVSGGISAYKAILVCRHLVDAGSFVSVVMTQAATHFVGEATFSALASERVHTSMWNDWAGPIPHTKLGQNADLVLICPATANVIGKYVAGISDDLVTNTLIASKAPVVVCPAMHTEMWEAPAIQANIKTLIERGVHIVAPAEGRLAGGDIGKGRLAEPEIVVEKVRQVLKQKETEPKAASAGPAVVSPVDKTAGKAEAKLAAEPQDAAEVLDMTGTSILITAGGTREPIDPIRFIGNRSTGKQGYAFANVAAKAGAQVTLISTVKTEPAPGVNKVSVTTAAEMHQAVMQNSPNSDIIVMAAAVADFRPVNVSSEKIKKHDGLPTIRLERTADILADLGNIKPEGQTIVGFAAETQDLVANAKSKLQRKKADYIVANDVSAPQTGFGHDTNAVVVLSSDGSSDSLSLASKHDIARAVLKKVMAARNSG